MREKPVKYPFLDLNATTRLNEEELIQAVARVVRSGRYIGGEECKEFEEKLSKLTGSPYCVGVSNGLDALRMIFRAYIELGYLAPGDEVIVPANTYIASILAVTEFGLIPVFVEPDSSTLNLDWSKIEEVITLRTKAVLTVHLYGRVSWDEEVAQQLRERNLLILEDNAQAIGAVSKNGIATGALGDAAAFSFYPTKNIGAFGDAGAITTRHKEVRDMVSALANYGSDRRYHNIVCGFNCRLDSIQAAILNVKLKYIEQENARRRELAAIYSNEIKNPKVTLPLAGDKDMVWHQYVVRVNDREEFTEYLDKNAVGWDIHYATPPHLQPCYSKYANLNLPITEKIAATVVSLPMSAVTFPEDAIKISEIINGYR